MGNNIIFDNVVASAWIEAADAYETEVKLKLIEQCKNEFSLEEICTIIEDTTASLKSIFEGERE